MSNVQLSADRVPCDLDHFVYSSGQIGRLKVLSTVPVCAGDSFELHAVGAFRLSPLRRGLMTDSVVDVFTFYIPHRHSYGQEFVDMMKAGIPTSGLPASLSTDPLAPGGLLLKGGERASFLGTHTNTDTNVAPKFLYQSYLKIYNNYFKNPYSADVVTPMPSLQAAQLRDGFEIAHLESIWSKPLNPNTAPSYKHPDMAGNDGIDIIGLNASYALLQTQQERTHFMQRYRDIVEDFGGSTTYDVDIRPRLLMRSNFWASGYDTDGTDQTTLGQFSGRVQQPFSHTVPKFYVPEHGVIMTLIACRFPPIHEFEMHPLIGRGALDYYMLANDPAITANCPYVDMPLKHVFSETPSTYTFKTPYGQWYRFMPNHVDFRYRDLMGFPFLTDHMGNDYQLTMVDPTAYDKMFQTTQLGHWNVQSKMNCTVYRNMPTARDSIMTS